MEEIIKMDDMQKLASSLVDYMRGNGGAAVAYVDGSFGTGTQTALKAFQKAHNLTADGIAGSNTFAVLCG